MEIKNALISQMTVDSCPLAVTVLDDKMRFIDCNDSALKLFQVPDKKDFLDNYFMFSAHIQPNGMFAGDLAYELIQSACENGEAAGEWMYKNKNNEPVPCKVILKKLDFDDSYIIIKYDYDLRDEIKAQAVVTEITERNKIMIDATPVCFVFFNDEFDLVDCNPAALELFGIPTVESLKTCFFELSPERQKDGSLSSASYKTNMQRTFNEGRLNFEWDHITREGVELPVEVTFVRVEYNKGYRIAGYFRDLREHKAMLAERYLSELKLIEAKELAEDITRIKSEFLANMSHEIRTPMNSIIAFTELAMDEEISPGTRSYLQKILSSSQLQLKIINNILDISKIESKRMTLESIPFNLHKVLDACRNALTPETDGKGIEFIFNVKLLISKSFIGDQTRLQQTILNLLSNAVKFTQTGIVKITVMEKKQSNDNITVGFEIEDSGIGMTPEQLLKVFEPFEQAESGTTRRFGGTGLGLSITKSLIELMGGTMKVESTQGVGSKFSFDLTFGIADMTEDLLSGNEAEQKELEKPLFNGEILVCEDTRTNQVVISKQLNRIGLEAVIADNGKIGVEKVAERKSRNEKQFDLIFMDIRMPVMDGIKAAKEIISLDVGIPIIALTANVMVDDRESYKAAGMFDYLGKPFTSQELWRCLMKYLTPVSLHPADET